MKVFPRYTKDEIIEVVYLIFLCALAFGVYTLYIQLGYSAEDSENFMYAFIYIVWLVCLVACLLLWHKKVRKQRN